MNINPIKFLEITILAFICFVVVFGIREALVEGPINRAANIINDKLDSEFVVDNYKAECRKLNLKKTSIIQNIEKFKIEQKIVSKKLLHAYNEYNIAKKNLISSGSSDLRTFNRIKDIIDSIKIEIDNLIIMNQSYSNATVKLENALHVVEANISKSKTNIATLENKKVLVDSIKNVNKIIESINGIENNELGISIEKLNDDAIRESIKLEAFKENEESIINKQQAEAYLQKLQIEIE